MGIIKSKSKIPSPIHGSLFVFTGIKILDDIYKELEFPIKGVNKTKSVLDELTTSLIKSIGARQH